MALNKIGLDYYSVNTNRYLDVRIKKLKKNLGCDGLAIYDYILCEVYRDKGCFLVWDESTVFDVADYFNVKESLVQEVVIYCAAVGLFDKGLLESGRIITSQSIQSRYLDACTRMKRKSVMIPEICAIPPEQSEKIPEQFGIPPEESQQSKVKESKVEKSKGKAIAIVGTAGADASLKAEYSGLLESVANQERNVIWDTVRSFIVEKKPMFFSPYMDLWNLFAIHYGLIKEPSSITEKRQKKFNTRIREQQFDFIRILEKVQRSRFLRGNNDRSWKVSIEFILESEENYIKILEEKYD